MRPTSVSCAHCGADGVVLALPGSVCNDCHAPWRVIFWEGMKLPERERACQRVGKTVDQMFGAGATERFGQLDRSRRSRWVIDQIGPKIQVESLWKELIDQENEKIREAIDQKIVLQLTLEISTLDTFDSWSKKDMRT